MAEIKKKKAIKYDEASLLEWLWKVAQDNVPRNATSAVTYVESLASGLTILQHYRLQKHNWSPDTQEGRRIRDEIDRIQKLLGALALDEDAPTDVRLQAAKAVLS